MKRETMHVNQDDLNFHYKRDERIAMKEELDPPRDQSKCFWCTRRNKIILLDLVIVVVLFLIYQIFLAPQAPDPQYKDLAFSLQAFDTQGSITLFLDVSPDPDVPPQLAGSLVILKPGEDFLPYLVPSANQLTEGGGVKEVLPVGTQGSRIIAQYDLVDDGYGSFPRNFVLDVIFEDGHVLRLEEAIE